MELGLVTLIGRLGLSGRLRLILILAATLVLRLSLSAGLRLIRRLILILAAALVLRLGLTGGRLLIGWLIRILAAALVLRLGLAGRLLLIRRLILQLSTTLVLRLGCALGHAWAGAVGTFHARTVEGRRPRRGGNGWVSTVGSREERWILRGLQGVLHLHGRCRDTRFMSELPILL